ncbi:MAG TPA: MBL fold metallo-hydrolase [Acidobacteriaceae bacterium]|jgi:glyoxylase-like metal-dependent hydrolase (beta-lactamase superfamily II)|nr:MBL fold metallo-hydrolase [Acidobacteriaceae bacterium]
MIRETFPVGMLQCNCTILGDEQSREAIVVDPGFEVPRILATLAKHQLTVKHIVITHAHIDHIGSALELKRITGSPILYNQADLPLIAMMDTQAGWLGIAAPEVKPPDHSPADTEVIAIRGLETQVIHTPGHTEGSLSLLVPAASLLLAGDTLFAGSVGRTDLEGGNHHKLIASIRERLLPLPDATVVVPGHGPATTIGEERASNPFLV